MKKSILFLLLSLLLLLPLTLIPCAAAGDVPVVYDAADLLSADAEKAILEAAREAESASGCAFYVATYKGTYMYTGVDFLFEHDLSEQDDSVILVITLDRGTYYYDMYYYGRADGRINQKEVDYILDHDEVYDNLKSGELEAGTCAFLRLAAKGYAGRIGASYFVIGLISFAIAIVIGLVACAGVKAAYSMKKKSVDYPLNRFAKLNLTAHNDVFVGSFVTKRVIQSNSGGGGGGSSHGGGRGHAGGR